MIVSKSMKSPAFNFYSSDFLTGTIFMSNEQKGAYITLMCYQHQYGHLTLEQIQSVTNDPSVLSKFINDNNGLFYNERLEKEITKKEKYRESRINNLNSRNNHMNCHMDDDMEEHIGIHMENEIEIENIKEIINYLNNKLNSNYKYSTRTTKDKIKARLNEGFKLDDFIAVIDKKTEEWLNTDMEKYLRPETLFGTKFESYLNQKNIQQQTHKSKTASERIKEIIEEEKIKNEQARSCGTT